MEVSTLTRTGEHDVVRTLPFVQAAWRWPPATPPRATIQPSTRSKVFAEEARQGRPPRPASSMAPGRERSQPRTVDFPVEQRRLRRKHRPDGRRGRAGGPQHRRHSHRWRHSGCRLALCRSAALRRPLREPHAGPELQRAHRPQNVSYAAREMENGAAVFAEDIIPSEDQEIARSSTPPAIQREDGERMADAFGKLLNSTKLRRLHAARRCRDPRRDQPHQCAPAFMTGRATADHRRQRPRPVRARRRARSQSGRHGRARRRVPEVRARSNLPTVYDGIYRAAFSYGLNSR
jgi:hypothetical protein